jgi:3-oxoacyl-ACP reductase-like protein
LLAVPWPRHDGDMNLAARFLLLSTTLSLAACGGNSTPTPQPTTPPPAANPPAGAPAAAKVDPTGNVPKAPEPTPAAQPANAAATPAAAAAAPSPADLGKVLETITDGPTAQAAKDKLDAILTQLKSAKAAVTGGQLGGDLGKLAGAAASKAGIDLAAIKAAAGKQLDSLLQNEAVKGAIGPTLEQIKALLQ